MKSFSFSMCLALESSVFHSLLENAVLWPICCLFSQEEKKRGEKGNKAINTIFKPCIDV